MQHMGAYENVDAPAWEGMQDSRDSEQALANGCNALVPARQACAVIIGAQHHSRCYRWCWYCQLQFTATGFANTFMYNKSSQCCPSLTNITSSVSRGTERSRSAERNQRTAPTVVSEVRPADSMEQEGIIHRRSSSPCVKICPSRSLHAGL